MKVKVKTTISGASCSIKSGEVAECVQEGKSNQWFVLKTKDGREVRHIPKSLIDIALEEL